MVNCIPPTPRRRLRRHNAISSQTRPALIPRRLVFREPPRRLGRHNAFNVIIIEETQPVQLFQD